MLTKFNRRTVATDSGEIIPHATVSFYWQVSGLPATVYADPEGETPLGASVQSDPQGRLGVFLLPGYYRIVVTLGGEILDELTYEPIVNELAVSGSTDVAVHMAEMEVPSVTSYLRTLPSGFSEWRTPVEVKSDLSLDQVNNTSDASKPVSTAVASALAGKINNSEKGAPNGVATLTEAGLIPPMQLPSYVDDVLEYANYAALPVPGESGKIYITANTNQQYRWSGSAYVAMVSSPGSTDAVPEGSTNKYFTEARVRTTPLTGYTLGSNTSLASTDTILAALGKVQGQLNGKATTAQGAKADTALQPGANLSALTNDLALISQEAGDGRYARRSQNLADLDSATTARANLGLGTAATANVTTSATDTTAGRMLQVGDYGFGLGRSFANLDMNTLTSPGVYAVDSVSSTNVPVVGAAMVCEVWAAEVGGVNARIMQQATVISGSLQGRSYIRAKSATSWSAWNQIWHSGDLTPTTVGYLSGLANNVQTQLDGKAPATVEQNTRNASYTLALTDNNKHLYHSNSSAYTWTIPPNSSVAFPIGATVTFVNDGSGNITIAQSSGVTIVEAGNGTTGNKNLGAAGMATALKVGTDRWFLNGAGIY